MFAFSGNWRHRLLASILAFGFCVTILAATWAEEATKINGRELFMREWIPGDTRSHGGDGLGPVFNDTSCVACHNQGGVGGAGPAAKNAQIVTAFSHVSPIPQPESTPGSLLGATVMMFSGGNRSKPPPPPTAEDQARIDAQRDRLFKIHPGFRTARSVVLHRFSTDSEYAAFRGQLNAGSGFRTRRMSPQTVRIDDFTFFVTDRNALPLFGSGKIDAIPDKVLLAAAEKKYDDFPGVSGRVAKLKNGWIGRFGWKAQKARLSDFVLTACAVELGLNVPNEPQSGLPHKPEYAPQGLDLNQDECNALTSFIRSLPAPQERSPANEREAEYLAGGRKLFATVGCAACHTPQLGEVAGIYSDLLLHDMGRELGDAGSYGSFVPNSTEEEGELQGPVPPLESVVLIREEPNLIGATRQEWRTPPLWGLRDSAPYMHDGRAATIEEAILMHAGEAFGSVKQYILLPAEERLQLTLFLRSLAAPQ